MAHDEAGGRLRLAGLVGGWRQGGSARRREQQRVGVDGGLCARLRNVQAGGEGVCVCVCVCVCHMVQATELID